MRVAVEHLELDVRRLAQRLDELETHDAHRGDFGDRELELDAACHAPVAQLSRMRVPRSAVGPSSLIDTPATATTAGINVTVDAPITSDSMVSASLVMLSAFTRCAPAATSVYAAPACSMRLPLATLTMAPAT